MYATTSGSVCVKQEALDTLRTAANKGSPFAKAVWTKKIVARHGLGYTVLGWVRSRKTRVVF
jgi:hypothetical protein